jgi:hypothetical protein
VDERTGIAIGLPLCDCCRCHELLNQQESTFIVTLQICGLPCLCPLLWPTDVADGVFCPQVTATPVDRPGAAGSGSGSRHPSSHSAASPVMSQYEAQLWKAMDNAKGYHKGKQYHHNKPKTGAGSKLALERQQFRKEQAGLGFSSGACSATAAASRQQPQHMRANHANSDVQRRTVPQPPAAVLTDLDDMLRPGSRSLGPTSSILPRRPVITIASLTGRAGPPSGRGAPPAACHAGPTQSVGSQAFKAAPTLNGILQTILTWCVRPRGRSWDLRPLSQRVSRQGEACSG